MDELKHFYAEDYIGKFYTTNLKYKEEFLYTTKNLKTNKEVTFKCRYEPDKHIKCHNCAFRNYLCYGVDCRIIALKIINNEKK